MIEQILKIGDRWYKANEITKEEKQLIKTQYRKDTSENMGDCPTCLIKMYLYFKTKSQNPMKNDQQFLMHKGKVLMRHGSQPLTRDNCSDDAALNVLKRTPGAIKFFEKFPENWQEQAQAHDPKKKLNREGSPAALKGTGTNADNKTDAETIAKEQYDLKLQNLEAKSEKELKEWAESIGLPEAEWKNKKKNGKASGIVAYLMEATKAE